MELGVWYDFNAEFLAVSEVLDINIQNANGKENTCVHTMTGIHQSISQGCEEFSEGVAVVDRGVS